MWFNPIIAKLQEWLDKFWSIYIPDNADAKRAKTFKWLAGIAWLILGAFVAFILIGVGYMQGSTGRLIVFLFGMLVLIAGVMYLKKAYKNKDKQKPDIIQKWLTRGYKG